MSLSHGSAAPLDVGPGKDERAVGSRERLDGLLLVAVLIDDDRAMYRDMGDRDDSTGHHATAQLAGRR